MTYSTFSVEPETRKLCAHNLSKVNYKVDLKTVQYASSQSTAIMYVAPVLY